MPAQDVITSALTDVIYL